LRIFKTTERSFLHLYVDDFIKSVKHCFMSRWGQGRGLEGAVDSRPNGELRLHIWKRNVQRIVVHTELSESK